MNNTKKRRGFTIVELVIVIAVIAILATVLVPTFGNIVSRANDSKAMQEARNAYTEYFIDNDGTTVEFALYNANDRWVVLKNGVAEGIYNSKEAAVQAWAFDESEINDTGDGKLYLYGGEAVNTQIDFSQLTYVAFGDSITYGVDGNYPSTSDIPENHGEGKRYMANPYPKLVGETLGIGTVNNQGVSSATFCQHQTRPNMTQKILAFTGNADIISLMLGVNDFSDKLPLGDVSSVKDNNTIYGSLYLIAEHLTEKYPDAFIFFMTPFKCRYGEEANRPYNLSDVADAIKNVAAQYDIPVLDMYEYGKYEIEMKVAPNDGIHPSQQHHIDYTAPLISEFIMKNYEYHAQ